MKILWYLLKNILMSIECGLSGGSYIPQGASLKGSIVALSVIWGFIIIYFLIYLIFRKKKKIEVKQSRKIARRYLLYSILLFCIVCIIGELIIENIK